MKEDIIKKYIDKITISDINSFANKNNINLNNNELNIIYKYIKNDWKTIIYGNYSYILNDLPPYKEEIESILNKKFNPNLK